MIQRMKCKDTIAGMISITVWVGLIFMISIDSRAQSLQADSPKERIVVVGFVGGLNNPDDIKQGVVQIRDRLKNVKCDHLQVATYSHFHWRQAFENLFHSIDSDNNGQLSAEEISHAPRIVIFGHSLGGWAVIKLAKKLNQIHIPVELTVQLDTVGPGDEVVPTNVRFAINYYQRSHWPIRGEKRIRARDGHATQIIDNILLDNVTHEALARDLKISNFIAERVEKLCSDSNSVY